MDDDGLVLNLATDVQSFSAKGIDKKGGRWTDRLKAKRVAKRKTRPGAAVVDADAEPRPEKRPRTDPLPSTSSRPTQTTQTTHPRPPTQIISSLFSYNPKVDAPTRNVHKLTSQPSNAPLDGSSSFSGLGLDLLLTSHLMTKMSITKPTSIQRASLPVLLSMASEETAVRDVFIQSQTGSGKTLSFLLPIIQDLLPLSTESYIDRSIGTLAIIIAPTRELAKQISDVLETLLQLRLRPEEEAPEDPSASSTRLTRWLVSGLLTGGATRTHEKARLRKGIPILVSTPGRLLDHLQNTSSFNVGKCRWLVLDEADRLMELGFEETITGIIQGLDGRRRLALQALEQGKSMEVGGWDWERRRRTVLCSATIREDVQKLAGTTLIQPLMIKATESDVPVRETNADNGILALNPGTEKFTPPSQLSQKYVIVPLKLRLVALIALLRSLVAQSQGRKCSKIIVFLSCTDSVDFHWRLLGSSSMEGDEPQTSDDEDPEDDSNASESSQKPETSRIGEKVAVTSPLLPDTSIFRLHGSLPAPTRLASLRGFSAVSSTKLPKRPSSSTSILLCTSVASRGLDLPLVRAVIQYDLPTEGGATEYVHRVGRTARVGKGGEAWSLVAPSEAAWVKWVEGKMRGDVADYALGDEKRNITLEGVGVESVLRTGFGGKGGEYEERATDVQLSFERWVARQKENTELARKAYLSHMRAYVTHPSNEKHIFHLRHLHIGHLAKAFALREAPKAVTGGSKKASARKETRIKTKTKTQVGGKGQSQRKERIWEEGHNGKAEKRMQDIVRVQGRLSKKGGVMISSGASEFQIAGGSDLEKLVGTRM